MSIVCLLWLAFSACATAPVSTAVVRPNNDLEFAQTQFYSGHYDVAEFYLKKVLITLPEEPSAVRLLPWAYFFQSRFDKALTAFNRLHSLYPKNPGPLVGMGWSYFSLGNYESALESFDKAAQFSSDPFQARKGKGFCHLKLYRRQPALEEFQKIYSPEEIEQILSLWEQWRGNEPDTQLRVISGDADVSSLFALPPEKPRYPGALLGYPAESDSKPIDRAWKLFNDKSYHKALSAFSSLPFPQAGSLDAKNGLAWSYLHTGKIKNAEEEFRAILRVYPKFPGALEGIKSVEKEKRQKAAYAQYYYDTGKYKIAGDKFKKLTGEFPDWSQAYDRLGSIDLQQENYDKARENFQTAIELDPSNAVAREGLKEIQKTSYPELFKAEQALEQGDYKSAARLYYDYVESQGEPSFLSDTLAHAYNGWGWSLLGKGQYPMAAEKFLKIKNHPKLEFDSARGAGLAYFALENYEKAARYLKVADELRPNRGDIVQKLDWSALRSMSPDKSEKHFKEALSQDPLRSSAYLGLGWVYYKSGKPDLGVEYFLKAISLDPDFSLSGEFAKMLDKERFGWQVYNRLGWAYYHRQQYSKSLELFKTSSQRQPNKSETLKGLGYNYYRLENYEQAVLFLQKCLSENATPNPMVEAIMGDETIAPFTIQTSAHTTIGRSYYRLGQYQEAVVYFNLELAQHPGWPEVHDGLGWANLKLNRLAEARAAFNEALRLQPLLASSRKGLNDVKQALAASKLRAGDSSAGGGNGK